MSSSEVGSAGSTETAQMSAIDMGLEVVTVPVSDVERAKRFYQSLGWRLDADFAVGDDARLVQMTPPHSQCSIHFGKGVHGILEHPVQLAGVGLTFRIWLGSRHRIHDS